MPAIDERLLWLDYVPMQLNELVERVQALISCSKKVFLELVSAH
jgi:hypothetical protein